MRSIVTARESIAKMSAPLVTIGVPTYNAARTIERTFASLQSQSWPNIEIIICDDASSDETAELCEAFTKRCAHARFYRNEKNLGGFENLARIISLSKGKYFAWICPDDYCDPDYIRDLTNALERDQDAVAAMPAVEFFCETTNGRQALEVRLPQMLWPQHHGPMHNLRMALSREGSAGALKKNSYFLFIHGLIRKELFADVLHSHHAPITSERQIVSLFALAGRLIYIDEILFHKYTPRTFVKKNDEESLRELLDSSAQRDFVATRDIWDQQKFPTGMERARQLSWAVLRSKYIPVRRKIYGIAFILAFAARRALATKSRVSDRKSPRGERNKAERA